MATGGVGVRMATCALDTVNILPKNAVLDPGRSGRGRQQGLAISTREPMMSTNDKDDPTITPDGAVEIDEAQLDQVAGGARSGNDGSGDRTTAKPPAPTQSPGRPQRRGVF